MKFAPKRTLFVLFVLFVSSCEPNLLCVPARNHLHHLGVAPEESRTKTQRHKAEGVFGKAALAVWPLCVLCLCARNPCPSLHEPNRHKFIPAGERGLTPGKQKRGRDTVGARVPEPNRLGLRKIFANGWGGTRKTHQLGPAVRSADGAGSRPCRRAPGYIPKSGSETRSSSHPVVGHPSSGCADRACGACGKGLSPRTRHSCGI
jgi:hypothetical protein